MKLTGFNREKEIFRLIFDRKQFAGAYIFSGIEGSGKLIFAKNLAKSLFCSQNSFFSVCSCNDCNLIENNSHPDVIVVDTEKNTDSSSGESTSSPKDSIGIDTIKELCELAFLSPYRGSYKVFIINDAHKMTLQASNAFLKTLEESPQNTLFLLVTHLPEKLLATIRSRCLIFEFGRLSKGELAEILREKFPDATPEDIEYACDLSSGSVKRAIEYIESATHIRTKNLYFDDINEVLDTIYRVNDKDGLKTLLEQLYINLLEKYREEKNNNYLTISNYLLNMLNMLQSNINLNIAKADLMIKLYGEFSGKS